MTWVNSKFKKKIEVKSGYTWSGDQELYENREGSTAVLRVSNIQDTLELDDILYLINVSEQHKIDKKISKNWTIAVNSNGNRNRVGKGIFIEEDMEFLFASFLVAFKPFDENEIDPRYFYYWYSSETVQKRISAIAEGTTGLSNLELRYLKSQDIYHPASIIEQRFIANTINAVDKTIQATKNSIAKLEKLKTSLMQNLLTGKMKPDGSWRTEDEFWIDDKFGKVPNGWTLKFIGDPFVSNINPLYDYEINQEFDFLEMAAVENNFEGIKQYDKVFLSKKNSGYACYKNGDILFAKITPCTENGKIAIIENCTTGIGFGSTEFIVISPTPNINNYLLYSFLSLGNIHKRAIALMEGTTGRQRVPWKIFKNVLQIPFPTEMSEQLKIVEPLQAIDKNLKNRLTRLNHLLKVKKSLMQNLLTGKVRIPQEALK